MGTTFATETLPDVVVRTTAEVLPTLDLTTAAGRAEARRIIEVGFRATHDQYPQYADYPETRFGRLVRVRQDVRTKMGLAFAAGDVTVEIDEGGSLGGRITFAYSWRNAITTAVPAGSLEPVVAIGGEGHPVNGAGYDDEASLGDYDVYDDAWTWGTGRDIGCR